MPTSLNDLPNAGNYRCIVADPPWSQPMTGRYKGRRTRPKALPYETMPLEDIANMGVGDLGAEDCHLWLWTTNAFLEPGFEIMRCLLYTSPSPRD